MAMLQRLSLITFPFIIMLVIIVFYRGACFVFARIAKNQQAKSSEGKVTNTMTPGSLLEVKVTLPIRVISSHDDTAQSYDPSELVQLPKVRLGEGTLGPLFKVVLNCGSMVTVRMIRGGFVKPQEFDFWMKFLHRVRGTWLSPILFSFWYGGEAFVVNEYMCLGSLEDLLHGCEGIHFTPLNWAIRRNIALCAAMAVASIHALVLKNGKSLVCGVIKASNVLIQIDFSACLSGYETPYLVSPVTIIRRNPGRVAPELVHSYVFTKESDVYSFGVLLLELITGKKPMVSKEHGEVKLVEYVKDERKKEGLQGICDKRMGDMKDNVANMIGIAELCLLSNPNERPAMDRVVKMIQQLEE